MGSQLEHDLSYVASSSEGALSFSWTARAKSSNAETALQDGAGSDSTEMIALGQPYPRERYREFTIATGFLGLAKSSSAL